MNTFAHTGHNHDAVYMAETGDSILRTMIFWGLIILVLASSAAALHLKSKAKKHRPVKRPRIKKAS